MAIRKYMTMMEINNKVNPIISDVSTLKSDVNSLLINKADNIHTHAWSAITNRPTLFSGDYNDLTNKPSYPADLSNAITDLQNNKADKSTVTSLSSTVSGYGASITKFQNTRNSIAGLTDVPSMPTQGPSLTVLGLSVVSFSDFNNLWNYCQQLGSRIQSMIAAHRPA